MACKRSGVRLSYAPPFSHGGDGWDRIRSPRVLNLFSHLESEELGMRIRRDWDSHGSCTVNFSP